MRVYQTKEIRNVSLMGGPGSGKTTLAECMLFEGGVIDRKGNVESKNTTSDYKPIEHERLNSVYSTVLFAEYNDRKINFIDNPGFDDFVGEAIASMKVADVSLLLMNTNNGIEVGTELSWRHAAKYKQPIVLVANHLDHEKAEFDDLVKEAKDFFGNKVIVVQYPYNAGKGFDSIIDVITMKLYKYPVGGGKPEILDIPSEEKEKAEELQNALVEAAAENDDALMELFFDKGTLNEDEMRSGIKLGLINRDIFPVFCTSAKNHIGITRLMEFIINVIPSPDENPMKSDQGEDIVCEGSKPASVFVYKTAFEEHLGEVSFMKVVTGDVTEGVDFENVQTGSKERISQLYMIAGKKREKVNKACAGDLFATIKMKNTKTNNTLNAKGSSVVASPIDFPEPKIRTAVKAINNSDDEKLAAYLLKMNVADATIIFEYSKELKQMLIHGQGELHINIAKWHLETEQKIPVEFFPPRISYRETITKQTLSDYKHKKQSGGSGQFGEVYLMIEPFVEGMPDPPKDKYNVRGKEEITLPWGGKLVFINGIVGGVIDTRYLPAVLKGIMEKMEEGPLTGSYARDIRVTAYDGKMHPVDSNEISFKLAGKHAFARGFKNAGPKLLEPIYLVEVVVPEERMGDVITDIQGRRGMILGMEGEGIYQKVKANVPLADMNKYSTTLSSITNGRASYSMKYVEYQQVPPDVQDRLLKEYEESKNEED